MPQELECILIAPEEVSVQEEVSGQEEWLAVAVVGSWADVANQLQPYDFQ